MDTYISNQRIKMTNTNFRVAVSSGEGKKSIEKAAILSVMSYLQMLNMYRKIYKTLTTVINLG